MPPRIRHPNKRLDRFSPLKSQPFAAAKIPTDDVPVTPRADVSSLPTAFSRLVRCHLSDRDRCAGGDEATQGDPANAATISRWFADLFNALDKAGFKLVLFLVGSYHLQKWNIELQGKAHAHIRSRFFSQEHPLRGLANLDDFRRCLHRYDADTEPFGGPETFTSHFQSAWHAQGGRLADHAGVLRQAFGEACERLRGFEVPMAYFALAVRTLLDQPPLKEVTLELMRTIVTGTPFAKNYDPGQITE